MSDVICKQDESVGVICRYLFIFQHIDVVVKKYLLHSTVYILFLLNSNCKGNKVLWFERQVLYIQYQISAKNVASNKMQEQVLMKYITSQAVYACNTCQKKHKTQKFRNVNKTKKEQA
jgi:hypothetical protein